MKPTMRLLIAFLLCLPAFATDTGWCLFQTAADVTGGDSNSWTNPNNALSTNVDYSYCTISNAEISNYLTLTNPDFSASPIPSGATIDGIEIRFYRGTSGTDIRDDDVRIVKAGSRVGTNLGALATEWPTSPANADYGGASNLWGTTWADTDFGSTMGVALQVEDMDNSSDQARVVTVRIKVHYTAASGMTVQEKTRGFFNN